METPTQRPLITVTAIVQAPADKVWAYWTAPEHITRWNAASPDWHTPFAENDCRVGGQFRSRMEAKDGSFGFDFGGVYDEVTPNEWLRYTLGDCRTVTVKFESNGTGTKVIETFEAEGTNPLEMQQGGWQAILDNFQRYVEAN